MAAANFEEMNDAVAKLKDTGVAPIALGCKDAWPAAQLLGYQRVTLKPGASLRVTFDVPTRRSAFSDRSLRRIVEPGDVGVWVGTHALHEPRSP